MNKGEGEKALREHLEGVGREAMKLGYFEIVNNVLNDIRYLEDKGPDITGTTGLFCTECHKPRNGS